MAIHPIVTVIFENSSGGGPTDITIYTAVPLTWLKSYTPKHNNKSRPNKN